jgi:hypothetical protein
MTDGTSVVAVAPVSRTKFLTDSLRGPRTRLDDDQLTEELERAREFHQSKNTGGRRSGFVGLPVNTTVHTV